jgi:3-hydroxyacyl-[acyl-carrier-protein] dehydratase
VISSELEYNILNKLPYSKPFLFVNSIIDVNENEITGCYKFSLNEDYYAGHFVNNPVTPGVLLIEVMGQIGLVCFGIYLLDIHLTNKPFLPYLSHIEADFIEPVYPGEQVTVHSVKEYFRNDILKCKIKMINSLDRIVLTKTAICTFKILNA